MLHSITASVKCCCLQNSKILQHTMCQCKPKEKPGYHLQGWSDYPHELPLLNRQKIDMMKKQHSELRKTKLQHDWLIEKLERLTQSQGASVDIQWPVQNHKWWARCHCKGPRRQTYLLGAAVSSSFEEGSISKSDCRGMRWHPLMIRQCLYLWHQSQ